MPCAANRARLTERLGRPVVYMDQCHGAEVAVVDGVPDVAPSCDAVVTRSTEVALAVLVADCVPVLLSGRVGWSPPCTPAGRVWSRASCRGPWR